MKQHIEQRGSKVGTTMIHSCNGSEDKFVLYLIYREGDARAFRLSKDQEAGNNGRIVLSIVVRTNPFLFEW
jgi:hypothetical protein